MNIADNIKTIREHLGLKQIQVAQHIGVDKSAYSKIEKGTRSLTIEELQKMAQLFQMTADDLLNYDGNTPKQVSLEDKSTAEQFHLIAQLEEQDKKTVLSIINTMLTNQKFKAFFQQQLAH